MVEQIVGVTLEKKQGQASVGYYQSDGAAKAFFTDEPYQLTQGGSLKPPISVFDAGEETFLDEAGKLQNSIPLNIVELD